MNTISIDQSFINNAMFVHRFIQSTKKLYKHAGKCDDQQWFKDILEDNMVSTIEGLTKNSPRSSMTTSPFNTPSVIK